MTEEVKLMEIAMRMQNISITTTNIEKFIKTYELIKEKGDQLTMKDLINLETK